MLKNKNTMKNPRNKSKKKKVIIFIVVLVLLAGGAYAFMRDTSVRNSDTPAEEESDTINFTPATDEEKQETEDNKQRIINEQENATPPPADGSRRQVGVTVTSADANAVFVNVSGVIEDDGTCTATFTRSGTTVTHSGAGIANVSYTQCSVRPSTPLSSGNWQVVVTYTSPNAEGRSEAFAFTVQ